MTTTMTWLCIDTGYPLDPGNYDGPRHCTEHSEGTTCVFGTFRLDASAGLMTDGETAGG